MRRTGNNRHPLRHQAARKGPFPLLVRSVDARGADSRWPFQLESITSDVKAKERAEGRHELAGLRWTTDVQTGRMHAAVSGK